MEKLQELCDLFKRGVLITLQEPVSYTTVQFNVVCACVHCHLSGYLSLLCYNSSVVDSGAQRTTWGVVCIYYVEHNK